MKILLQNILISDPHSPYNNQHVDVLIEKGMIAQIGKYISTNDVTIVSGTNFHASPGWMDLHAHFRDPGFEFKETIETGANAAAQGGFTAVLLMPDTMPIVQSKSAIEYILKRSQQLAVDIVPAGAITQDLKGKEMAELYDMHLAGAKALPMPNIRLTILVYLCVPCYTQIILMANFMFDVRKIQFLTEGK